MFVGQLGHGSLYTVCGGQLRPNSGWWETELQLSEELGNCRINVDG